MDYEIVNTHTSIYILLYKFFCDRPVCPLLTKRLCSQKLFKFSQMLHRILKYDIYEGMCLNKNNGSAIGNLNYLIQYSNYSVKIVFMVCLKESIQITVKENA